MGKSIKDEEFTNIDSLKNKEFADLIKNKFNEFRSKRHKILTEKGNHELEKRVFLQTVDFLWRSHLQYLEHLRQVIGLRGYGQKDPLQEFKSETFKLFENLLNKIKFDFITFLNNLEVVSKEELPKKETKNVSKSAEENKPKPPERKMKRNEPCFCGSGKKYKYCCGAL